MFSYDESDRPSLLGDIIESPLKIIEIKPKMNQTLGGGFGPNFNKKQLEASRNILNQDQLGVGMHLPQIRRAPSERPDNHDGSPMVRNSKMRLMPGGQDSNSRNR